MESNGQKSAATSRTLLSELIQAAYQQNVEDDNGTIMPEAYLHDDWQIDEKITVNAITPEGLTFRQSGDERELSRKQGIPLGAV
jgi:hypothetical protein